ncbi:serine protease [Candidatus Saccharibacteria bacterium]|mgnify:CR=1 FL=1|nr:serine protease [Candidatus Saccharibacteria bacterium]MBQ68771.1 serine protease [Candidatus Saccharibacteria bacterium]|tara:strand:- start:1627 stop:3909 length:2283 start_codon:yes stop_codon:yes gene_type:complete
MNEVLQLRGRIRQRPSAGRGGNPSLPRASDALVKVDHITALVMQLKDLRVFWKNDDVLDEALIDVYYRDVIAKSNRIRALFANPPHKSANSTIRGARFNDNGHHTITHLVDDKLIAEAEAKLMLAARILEVEFGGTVTSEQLDNFDQQEKSEFKNIKFSDYGMSKSAFRQVIVDAYYVTRFDRPSYNDSTQQDSIVTLYKVDDDMRTFLRDKVGIDVPKERFIGDSTVLLLPFQMTKLLNEASYLVAMSVDDLNNIVLDKDDKIAQRESWMMSIDDPTNEPTIGVIDTQFDETVYFSKWVKYENMSDPKFGENSRHGTAISSIIVDGPSMNPDLDDGCGRFQVRHFAVIGKDKESASSFEIMRKIKKIVENNTDIKVWNLSLGSEREVAKSYISPEAALLDELQKKHDVIFVVSGTNYLDAKKAGEKLIGSPADSINSIVVNAVNGNGNPAIYSRRGEVLSFFKKPDIASFGGDIGDGGVQVCTPMGKSTMRGTSVATPWITRKVAFLIEVLGFSREIAKALIVDAAAGWTDIGNDPKMSTLMGYGAVPQHINNIVQSGDNEIKFFIDAISEQYDTYAYNLPVPVDNGKHPFIAKATLCYFPKCSINQGVDYTNTELDVYIGRMKSEGKNPGLKPIDKNVQSIEDGTSHAVREEVARKVFRKWDNTKHIREVIGDKMMPRKAYEDGLWGVSVKTKNRFDADDGRSLKFGLVITLKEMNNINRIRDFIRLCELRGWSVTRVDIDSRIEVYNKAQETINLDF